MRKLGFLLLLAGVFLSLDTVNSGLVGCKTSKVGSEYKGKLNKTIDGVACQRWDAQTPHKPWPTITFPTGETWTQAENYCRNPTEALGANGPWCYTTDPNTKWEYCDVPFCFGHCQATEQGREYMGQWSKTKSGKTCQSWGSQSPHSHSNNRPEWSNYCRNPDGAEKPWCYTTDPDTRWQYCDVPQCPPEQKILQIPKTGVRFRLYAADKNNKKMAKARGCKWTDFRSVAQNDNYDDINDGTWFYLEDCGQGKEGYYTLTSASVSYWGTNCRVYCHNLGTQVGLWAHFDTDQCWRFVFNERNEFQIVNYKYGGWKLVQRPGEGMIQVYHGANYRDQFFKFHLENVIVENVNFHLKRGILLRGAPKSLIKRVFENKSSQEQQGEVSVKYTSTKQESWEYTGGIRIWAEMKLSFQTGVPVVSEKNWELTLGFETTHTWTTGKVTTESKERMYRHPIKVPAGKKIVADVLIYESKASVPYTMTLRYPGSQNTMTSYGRMEGVEKTYVHTKIQEYNL